jgi:hypothetical protein
MRTRSIALLFAIACSCMLVACEDAAGPSSGPERVALGDPFWLSAGATAAVEGAGLRLAFLDVIEDTRCPVDVICITDGDFRLAVKASVPRSPAQELELNWHLRQGSDYARFRIQLVGIEPPRKQGEEIPMDEYQIQLLVTRA